MKLNVVLLFFKFRTNLVLTYIIITFKSVVKECVVNVNIELDKNVNLGIGQFCPKSY